MKKTKKRVETIDSIIGHHVYFEGILSSKESLRIDGRVKGKVECEGSVILEVKAKSKVKFWPIMCLSQEN